MEPIEHDAPLRFLVKMRELDVETCRERLAAARFGRLAFTSDDEITILPVNAALRGGRIIVRTADGSSIDRLRNGTRVAFEIDGQDGVAHTGWWSVVVRGLAGHITDEEALSRAEELDLHPWAPGAHDSWMSISPQQITGRHIERHAVLHQGEHLPLMPPD